MTRWLAALAIGLVVSCSVAMGQDYLDPSDGKPTDFPSFGVSLAGPKGWTRLYETELLQVARWGQPDGQTSKPHGLLQATVARTEDRTLKEYAEFLRDNFKATLSDKMTTLDGEPAYAMSVATRPKGLQFSHALVAQHGALFYVLSAWSDNEKYYAAELESVRQNWKWAKIEEPSAHLELGEKPLPLFRNLLLIKLPRSARPLPTQDPSRQVMLTISNRDLSDQEFLVNPIMLDIPEKVELVPWTEALTQELPKRLKFTGELKWDDAGAGLPALKSTPVTVRTGDQGQGAILRVRWILCIPEPGKGMLIQISMPDGSPHQKEYDALADRVAASLALPAEPAATPQDQTGAQP